MFKLAKASIYYGFSSYDVEGLPSKYEMINSVNDVNLKQLAMDIGRITSYIREFQIKHMDEIVVGNLVLPERIVAIANGYSVTWIKVSNHA